MSVTLLLCEGAPGGPDARVLTSILRGLPVTVSPSGGKQGLPPRVVSRRELKTACCAIADADFPRPPEQWTPSDEAQVWQEKKNNAPIGWLWRRKEIENYLLDAEVLSRTYSWDGAQRASYEGHLSAIWDEMANATAGRMALTACVPRGDRVDTSIAPWSAHGDVQTSLVQAVTDFNQRNLLDTATVITRWHSLVSECTTGGKLRAAAPIVFSGKDLRVMLPRRTGIQQLHADFKNLPRLEERVLTAIEKSPAPHDWLPEWGALRAAVQAWTPPP